MRFTIGIRKIGSPVVECFSTFETLKSREDQSRLIVGCVADIEASGVWEIRNSMNKRSGKFIVKTLAESE